MTTQMTRVTVPANPDADDCLSAAVESYVAAHPEAAGWELSPQWADDSNREKIVLTVPTVDPDAQCPEHGCARHACDEEH